MQRTRHVFISYAVVWTLFGWPFLLLSPFQRLIPNARPGIVANYLSNMATVQYMAFGVLDLTVYAVLFVLYRLRNFRPFLLLPLGAPGGGGALQQPPMPEFVVLQGPGGRALSLASRDTAMTGVAWGFSPV